MSAKDLRVTITDKKEFELFVALLKDAFQHPDMPAELKEQFIHAVEALKGKYQPWVH